MDTLINFLLKPLGLGRLFSSHSAVPLDPQPAQVSAVENFIRSKSLTENAYLKALAYHLSDAGGTIWVCVRSRQNGVCMNRANRHYFVTLQSETGPPITFWVQAPSDKPAIARALRLNGEPAVLLDIQPASGAADLDLQTLH